MAANPQVTAAIGRTVRASLSARDSADGCTMVRLPAGPHYLKVWIATVADPFSTIASWLALWNVDTVHGGELSTKIAEPIPAGAYYEAYFETHEPGRQIYIATETGTGKGWVTCLPLADAPRRHVT